MSQYVCSDIHGQYDLYDKMLEAIGFSDDDTLYIIGDIVDRGPRSIDILQDVIERPNVICLLGNHELMIRDHYKNRGEKRDCWLLDCNGGLLTKKAFMRLPGSRQQKILEWIDGLYLQKEVVIGDTAFLLSHSACLPDEADLRWREVDDEIAFNAVWCSPWRSWEYFPERLYGKDGRWHIIGHVPVQSIEEWYQQLESGMVPYINDENHVINIDLGCASIEHVRPFPYASLCCMDLTAWAEGKRNESFRFFGYEETPEA